MSDKTEAAPPAAELAIAEPSPIALIGRLIDQGKLTPESVGVVERLVALKQRIEEKEAERQFNAAFVRLQADTPKIKATVAVPNNDNTIRYHFAPYDDIWTHVQPLLHAHGFAVTFSMEVKDDRLTQYCRLMHVGGHSRTNQFTVRIGAGPPKATPTQADGAAATYAKRFALCSALNIVAEVDTDGADARALGTPITFEQAQTLREMVKETNSNEARFLAYAGAKTFEEIMSERYQDCFAQLQKKRNAPAPQ